MADTANKKKYLVTRGIDYLSTSGDGWKRAEIGDEVDDLMPRTLQWMVADGTLVDAKQAEKEAEKEKGGDAE